MLAALLDLVFPLTCAGCGRPGRACDECSSALLPSPRLVRPEPCPDGFPRTVAASVYDGVVRETLVGYKEHGRVAARPLLAAALRSSVSAAIAASGRSGLVVVVPVPSSRAAIRSRGRDPLLELARAAVGRGAAGAADRAGGGAGAADRAGPAGAADAGAEVVLCRGLRQVRRPRDQAGLGSAERAANLAGALAATPVAALRQAALVVVLDDVCTTGATLTEAARALRCVTGAPVWAAVVAATERRHPRPRAAAPADGPALSSGQNSRLAGDPLPAAAELSSLDRLATTRPSTRAEIGTTQGL